MLTGHENPDGDCLGAEVAFYALLKRLGHKVEIRNPDPISKSMDFLAERTPIGHQRGDEGLDVDLVVLLDCCNIDRVGRLAPLIRSSRPTVAVVDHHVGSEAGDGAFSFVDSTSPATGELVYRLFKRAGQSIDAVAAEGIFVSLVSDTGWFRYSNTSSGVLAIASELVDAGVDPTKIYDRIHRRNEPESVAFLSETLSRHRIELDGRYIHVSVDHESLERAKRIGFELDAVMEPMRSLDRVEVVAMFKELNDGRVKLSLRAVGEVDVQAIAKLFGGGGHKKAAGATISLPLVAARDRVRSLVEQALAVVPARDGVSGA